MKALAGLLLVVCVGCNGHKQPAAVDLLNDQAKVVVPGDVLGWTVLSTSDDHVAGTTSTLFGDRAAVLGARGGAVLGGASRALVTWRQREDPHWFGARIPGDPVSVEIVSQGPHVVYRRYVGKPLVPDAEPELEGRAAMILDMPVPRLP